MIRIERFATVLPPPSDAFHGELGGLMINTHIDESALVDRVIDSIGQRFAISEGQKVIHIDAGLLSFGLPLPSVVLEGAKQFLLLAIHRDDGMDLLFKLLACAIDVGKLRIPIRMR